MLLWCSFPVISSVWNRISIFLVLLPFYVSKVLCFKWRKSPLFSLMGLILRLSIYTCQHSGQHHLFSFSSFPLLLHFLSLTVLSSESPFWECPVHFLFLFVLCAFVKALLQTSRAEVLQPRSPDESTDLRDITCSTYAIDGMNVSLQVFSKWLDSKW